MLLFPDGAARVSIQLTSGKTLSEIVMSAKGSLADPLSDRDIEAKLRDPNVGNLIFLLQARRLQILLTWQYYDPWQIEQGNRDQAQENAERPGIAAGPFFFF
jgi:hypothetical protein